MLFSNYSPQQKKMDLVLKRGRGERWKKGVQYKQIHLRAKKRARK